MIYGWKMKGKDRKLVIIGAGEFGQIAYEYFTYDSEYEVIAFAVERKYRKTDELYGLPIINFENIEEYYPPEDYEVFVAITYVKLNTERTRLYLKCKELGYHCATYISSHAFVWHNVKIGENSFVFENNTLQHHVNIGNNVILWSGNHIGHGTVIGENCWLTSHCVISGFCRIGKGSFLGVNATLGDNVELGEDTVFGAGALTVKSLLESGQVYIGVPARKKGCTSYEQFGIMKGANCVE